MGFKYKKGDRIVVLSECETTGCYGTIKEQMLHVGYFLGVKTAEIK